MTVKVLEEKPDPSVVKQVVCRQCGAKLEYVPIDVKSRSYKDYDGGSDSLSYVECPRCKQEVVVRL